MKTKDGIAFWLLAFFILIPFGERVYEFTDALKAHKPISTVLWHFGISVIVGASGLFLISRFVHLTNDLANYEAEEKQREKESLGIK